MQPNNDTSSFSDSENLAKSTDYLMRFAQGLAVSNPDDPDLRVLIQQTSRILHALRGHDSGVQSAGTD